MQGVHKSFGAVRALQGVDLEVRAGEVHALIGENGAGKSTLMKVLSGAHAPDRGTMQLDGRAYRPDDPLAALDSGVAMIYQELNLAPHLTVEQNIMLGREARRFGFIQRRAMRASIARTLERLDHPEIEPARRVLELGPGARQLVEVARALQSEARVIVMDEPTSSLSQKDAARLFQVIRSLREQGVAIIYISHFLEELKEIADRFTVLRDGQSVATGEMQAHGLDRIIEWMVGRKLEEVYPQRERKRGEPLLQVRGLRGNPLPVEAQFELHRGEILGIAGLVGAGRTELLRSLFGLESVELDSLQYDGRTLAAADPRQRRDQGFGLLSEDRKEEGLALPLSIAENMCLSKLDSISKRGWIQMRERKRKTEAWIEALAIRCHGSEQAVGNLSGGNQQKVAFARLLHQDAEVLLLDEPTRGVDVGSKVEIYQLMNRLASAGKAILMVSSYIPELLGMCDRIAVMHRGRLGPARAVEDWTETALLDEAARGAA